MSKFYKIKCYQAFLAVTLPLKSHCLYAYSYFCDLSSELGARQAQREVVKIKIFDFAYWA